MEKASFNEARGFFHYAVAVVSSLAALGLSIALRPVIEPILFIFFFAALFVSAYRGGQGPGLVVVAIGALTSNYYLIPPLFEWNLSPLVLVRIGFFVAVGTTASLLSERNLRSEARARQAERATRAQQGALQQAVADANRSRAELEAVFQSVTEGIAVCDMQGNFILMNEAEARMNGFASGEEMRRNIAFFASVYELSYADGRPLPVNQWPITRVLRGESIVDWELRANRRDTGQEWFFSFSGEPVRDESGRQILAVVITRDITVQKRREQTLIRQSQELEQFAYVASHDLKEPLRKISNYAELLNGRYAGKLDEDAHRYLAYIGEGTRRMNELINDLLSYSSTINSDEAWTEVDLNRVAREVLADLQSAIEHEGATVRVEALPMVIGNATQLRQLLQNLISNALKFRGERPARVHVFPGPRNGRCASPCRTRASGSLPSIKKQSSRCSAAFMGRVNTRARALAWRCASESSSNSAAPSGWNPPKAAARRSGSRCPSKAGA